MNTQTRITDDNDSPATDAQACGYCCRCAPCECDECSCCQCSGCKCPT